MQLNSFYPVLMSRQLRESRDFYTTHFGFQVTFEADWYVSLKSADGRYELAFVAHDHATVVSAYQTPVAGLLLNFEVADVDAEYARLIEQAGLPLARALITEEFGQRHFATVDPNGVLIDVIQIVPPSDAFAAQYTEAAWSSSTHAE
ncbi:MAG: VOC family protein [Anaerolineae bacterium]|uniref:VOC family protein n=1 Tax=Candidatus Flexifilum breve TaxID=3140694 RepID=UPI001AC408C9|nr:VOC family protein [Chloroflexota bacterium]MBN8636200.1 VOC family protein [Anaerolineae bacterium]